MNTSLSKHLFSMIQELLICMRAFQKDAIFCEDVTFSQFNILHIVQESSSIEMIMLRNKLAVEKSTLTRLIEPLLQKKLLAKTRENNKSIISISIEGKEIHKRIWQCVDHQLNNALSNINDEEKANMLNGITGFNLLMKNCCTVCN